MQISLSYFTCSGILTSCTHHPLPIVLPSCILVPPQRANLNVAARWETFGGECQLNESDNENNDSDNDDDDAGVEMDTD